RAVGQLGQGPAHGAVPARLRRPDLPEEPLRRPRALQPRRVPRAGDRSPDPGDGGARRLGQTGLTGLAVVERTTRRGVRTVSVGSAPPARARALATAAPARAVASCETVVIWTCGASARRDSSSPTTETSPGTRRPRCTSMS